MVDVRHVARLFGPVQVIALDDTESIDPDVLKAKAMGKDNDVAQRLWKFLERDTPDMLVYVLPSHFQRSPGAPAVAHRRICSHLATREMELDDTITGVRNVQDPLEQGCIRPMPFRVSVTIHPTFDNLNILVGCGIRIGYGN